MQIGVDDEEGQYMIEGKTKRRAGEKKKKK